MADFYKKVTPSINFYGIATTGTEPDMRQELVNTFDGLFPEIAKSQPGLLRKMQRDSQNNLISCSCVDSITNEPDKDRWCPICYGEGFFWDEIDIDFYKVLEDSDVDNAQKKKLIEPGLINAPLVVFYVRYDVTITRDDKIIVLELKKDGTKDIPIKRKEIYRVNTPWDYRSDNGKLEYWKLFTHEEKVKFLNAPNYGDI